MTSINQRVPDSENGEKRSVLRRTVQDISQSQKDYLAHGAIALLKQGVFHKNPCTMPEMAFAKAFRDAGVPGTNIARLALSRRSRTSVDDRSATDPMTRWKQNLSTLQIDRFSRLSRRSAGITFMGLHLSR